MCSYFVTYLMNDIPLQASTLSESRMRNVEASLSRYNTNTDNSRGETEENHRNPVSMARSRTRTRVPSSVPIRSPRLLSMDHRAEVL